MSDPIKHFIKFADYIDDIVSDLKRHEGFRAKPYVDPAKTNRSIGYGFNIDARRNQLGNLANGITEQQASDLLYKIIRNEVIPGLRSKYKNFDKMPDHVKRGIANMYYNMGSLDKFKNMNAALLKGDWNTAAKEARNSRWYTQVKSRGPDVVNMIQGVGTYAPVQKAPAAIAKPATTKINTTPATPATPAKSNPNTTPTEQMIFKKKGSALSQTLPNKDPYNKNGSGLVTLPKKSTIKDDASILRRGNNPVTNNTDAGKTLPNSQTKPYNPIKPVNQISDNSNKMGTGISNNNTSNTAVSKSIWQSAFDKLNS